ncbi:MAG: helix-turn-helix domain-containing protein [Promethearchaeota archaeon]
MDSAKLTLTVKEAAKALGISRGLAYEMVKNGEIPSIRLGKRILVPQRALELLLECDEKNKSEGD